MISYANISVSIGLLVSSKMATLNDLQTVYGLEDAYDMLEILYVDAENHRRAQRKANRG